MLRKTWTSLLAVAVATIVGCLPSDQTPAIADKDDALALVQSDSARYGPGLHPLRQAEAGIVVDDIALLDGDWGRYDVEGQGGVVRETWAVLSIDVASGAFALANRTENTGGEPTAIAYRGELRLVGDNRIERTVTAVELGGDFAVGGPPQAGVEQAEAFESLVTIDGDYLLLLDGTSWTKPEELAATQAAANRSLWVRLPD